MDAINALCIFTAGFATACALFAHARARRLASLNKLLAEQLNRSEQARQREAVQAAFARLERSQHER
jgi:hypothetical protein